jgi:hypothetical protein
MLAGITNSVPLLGRGRLRQGLNGRRAVLQASFLPGNRSGLGFPFQADPQRAIP